MIKILIGNILESKVHTLVNTVNCVGIMGKGIAQLFKNKYNDMYKDYLNRCKMNQIKAGEPYIYTNKQGVSIINFPTKEHWRQPSRIEYIIKGLDIFLEEYKKWGVKSVAFPPLGCGNGGLDWKEVGPIMYSKLSTIDIPVELYAPYGTPEKQLKPDFLKNQNIPSNKNGVQQYIKKGITDERLAILEILYKLEQQKHAPKVGRTIFQHICYIFTEQNVPTNLSFFFGDYGPFSREVKDLITTFANSNLIQERRLGKMIEMTTGADYFKEREAKLNELNRYQDKIIKTVDLFCRIKNTTQSEEVASILFAYNKMKKQNGINAKLSESEIYKFIIQWEKNWDIEDKRNSIADAIRNLVLLKWIVLNYSEDLPVYEIAV